MMRSLIAIAALVACSGAYAELDRDYWQSLGVCAGLYHSGDSQNDSNGHARVMEKARKERQKLDNSDAYEAGYLFGQNTTLWQTFFMNQSDYHPEDDSEGFRQMSIDKAGCKHIY